MAAAWLDSWTHTLPGPRQNTMCPLSSHPHTAFAAPLLGQGVPAVLELLWRSRAALDGGPSSPCCYLWSLYNVSAGWMQAGLLCLLCNVKSIFQWPRRGLLMVHHHLRDCYFLLCVGTGLAQVLYLLLDLGMTGWPCLDVQQFLWIYVKNTSFLWTAFWTNPSSSALIDNICYGISHRYFQRRKTKGLCAS